jgi:hypothetical protein
MNTIRQGRAWVRIAIVVAFSLGASGCGFTKAQWKAAGIDVAKCLHPGIIDAASDAIITYLGAATGEGQHPDFAELGRTLVAKYGADAALCAIGKIWAHFGAGETPIKGQPAPLYNSVAYLIGHQDEWAK